MDTESSKGNKVWHVAVEGNIGCGKTSFLDYFAKEFDNKVKVFTEPVNKWKNVGGHNLLDLMFKDPKKWSFAFQQYVQLTMFEVHSEMADYNDENVILKICERSLLSARHCFVENLYHDGKMTRVEYDIINEWYKYLLKDKVTKLDYIIYLRTSPEVCLQRIKNRDRHEERCIDMAFLRALHKYHEDWLSEMKTRIRVISVDADVETPQIHDLYEKCSKEIFREISDRNLLKENLL